VLLRALHAAGASYAEIARECGVDWRTVRKYLAEDACSAPPTASPGPAASRRRRFAAMAVSASTASTIPRPSRLTLAPDGTSLRGTRGGHRTARSGRRLGSIYVERLATAHELRRPGI